LNRRNTELALNDAANLPRAQLELIRDRLEARLLVEASFFQSLNDQLRDALPVIDGSIAGRKFRAAPEAGAEAGLLGLLRAVEESAVRRLGRSGWAHGAAVDVGRRDADEEDAVEARIPGGQGGVQCAAITVHD
jgi:hypothetical protein